MNQASLSGLARAREIYSRRNKRAEELRQHGRKIAGFLCSFVPGELITAAGMVPYRITGNPKEPVTRTDAYIEPYLCPYVRNCFDLAIKEKFNFLDIVIMAHSCDGVQRTFGIWSYYLNPPQAIFLNVPHTIDSEASRFFKSELGFFKQRLEEISGSTISSQNLLDAVELYNDNRSLVRQLYMKRKHNPPLITGTEIMQTLVAGALIPADEFRSLLKEILAEIENRKQPSQRNPIRLLVWGSIMDDISFVHLIEQSGANVVVDDTCIGTRSFWNDVDTRGDIYEGLAKSYFLDFLCPRTYRGASKERFSYLGDLTKDFGVNGVILYSLNYCDPHSLDAPDVRDYLEELGLPVLHIEDDYTMANIEAVKTRIQAFLEIIDESTS
jgi:benzoyl-CoA reductase subunit C